MAYLEDTDRPSFLSQMIIDTAELQWIQDIYAKLNNLFIFSVNKDGKRITEISGNPGEIERIFGLVEERQIVSVLQRVLGSSVEEQVVED
ncbi:MAG TPA: hypothetical protein PLU43_11260, partial [Lachnospiraceae bacterium]|nr:hypothetical protein [Lachnospiraceae bacterium]